MHFLRRLHLIVLLSWNVTICTAQSTVIDSIITPSSLKELVQVLAADSFYGRLTGSDYATQVAFFLANEFKKAGAVPVAGNNEYFNTFTTREKAIVVNVVAAIPGKTKSGELVIFSAHYDHMGRKPSPIHSPERGNPEEEDIIYNGANDNASGVSALIHLARYYAKQQNNERTLIFIAFSGEEEGLLGSRKMATSFDPKVVKAVINMDMIGRPISENQKYPYLTGDEQSHLRYILNKKLHMLAPEYGNKYFKGDAWPDEELYKRSDNYPFALRGIVAHTIMTTSPTDKYYHSLNDEWNTLDYPFMARVVKAIALACTGLADGSDTPK
jgi:Zn-dependent M28 family amino/carboxypeptidase